MRISFSRDRFPGLAAPPLAKAPRQVRGLAPDRLSPAHDISFFRGIAGIGQEKGFSEFLRMGSGGVEARTGAAIFPFAGFRQPL
jgi:hypothetical protein